MNETSANFVCAKTARRLALAWAAALVFLASWFLLRRLAGGFGAAPSGLALLATALVLAGSSLAVRRLARLDTSFMATSLGRAVWLAPGIAWLLLGLAVATYAESGVGLAVYWLGFLISEGEAWLREGRAVLSPWITVPALAASPGDGAARGTFFPRSLENTAAITTIPVPASEADDELADLPDDVSLQLTRQQTGGGELVHGTARVFFEVGQRAATLHVSFGDPLAAVPEVLTELRTDVEVEIECAQALAHGVRFDLRLRLASAERTEVVFDFEAVAGPAESAAA